MFYEHPHNVNVVLYNSYLETLKYLNKYISIEQDLFDLNQIA